MTTQNNMAVGKAKKILQKTTSPSGKKVLTQEEKDRILFFKKCKTRSELKKWIKYFLEMDLPDTVVSRYADSTPLDAVWDVYDICVNKKNPTSIQELMYVAGRGSGKCAVKGTIIKTLTGPKYIENVEVGDIVYTGWSWQPVTCVFNEGIKDGVTIETNKLKKDGSSNLTGSLRHRIQALDPNTGKIDWVLMSQLSKGQIVYKSAHNSYDVDTSSEEYEKGWIAGNITGDGCLHRQHYNKISICGSDFEQLRHYRSLVKKHFNINLFNVKRNSKKSVSICHKDVNFYNWYKELIDGDLCYFKKLKTLEHSPNFLAGFVSGMMETDGSKDSITLANKDLTYQIGRILTLFGVVNNINNNRRKPSITKFVEDYTVTYHECKYSNLPDYLLPLFSKRQSFIDFRGKQNEQFRYPSILIKSFANYIKNKYEIGGGYWRLQSGKKTHSNIKYSKDLWGEGDRGKESYIYGYKIDYFIDLSIKLDEIEWVEYLKFIRNGYYETVNHITMQQAYFYDLEVEKDHSYWSNGFISHNTLAMAIVEFMVILHDCRDTAHVGSILSQAKRCYDYMMKYMYLPKVKGILMPEDKKYPKIVEKSNMEKTTFNIGTEKCSIEILPCTLKALNGFHGPLVVVDEIDTVSGEGLKAFKEISGMIDSRGDKQALRVGISTRKSRYGLMNQQIENAETEGRTVKRWTAFEFCKRCPDERSGVTPTEAYILQDKLEVIVQKDYDLKDEKKKQEYFKTILPGEKCLTCPAAAVCLGDAKNQTSTSNMLKPIDDPIKKIRAEGADWALAQLMNLKPSVEGIVYKEFEEKVHVKTWAEMWHTLTGLTPPPIVTHDMFIKKCHQMGLQSFAGIDWGWKNPHTITIGFIDKLDRIYIVKCDGMTFVSQPQWINFVKRKYHNLYKIQMYYPDQADQGAVLEMKDAGLPTYNEPGKPQINPGVQIIKKLLRTPGTNEPRLFIAQETCQSLIIEFNMYHYRTDAAGEITDDYEEQHDHWLDGLRYALHVITGGQKFLVANDHISSEDPIMAGNNTYHRLPTAEEFCDINNISGNSNQEDRSKIGKVGTISELESEMTQEDEVFGSGNFFWT